MKTNKKRKFVLTGKGTFASSSPAILETTEQPEEVQLWDYWLEYVDIIFT